MVERGIHRRVRKTSHSMDDLPADNHLRRGAGRQRDANFQFHKTVWFLSYLGLWRRASSAGTCCRLGSGSNFRGHKH